MGNCFQRPLPLVIVYALLKALCVHSNADEPRMVVVPAADAPKLVVKLVRLNAEPEGVHHIDAIVYGTSADHGRQQVENELGNKIYELTMQYELTPPQQSKLKRAAQSEAKQFFFEVDQVRRSYDAAKGNPDELRLASKAASVLNQHRKRLFGSDSFLSKVTTKTVTEEQIIKYQAVMNNRIRLRYRSNIEGAIRDIERQVVLNISQQEAMVNLMMDEFAPPKQMSDYDETLVKYQFTQLPNEKLQPLFNAKQWTSVRSVLDGFQEFEPILVQNGLINQIHHRPQAVLTVKESK